MIGVEGGPNLGPSPYSGLDKREWIDRWIESESQFQTHIHTHTHTQNAEASRKVVNMPPYSSLNNKREAPAYEELINFPRAKDKVRDARNGRVAVN
jgi:hypothetical protein